MEPSGNLSEILMSLMQDPGISAMISNIAKASQPDENAIKDKKEDAPIALKSSQSTEQGSINIPPEILSSLPQMMSALSRMGIGEIPSHSESKGESISSSRGNDRRKALLSALKPYLSPKRCSVIDGLLQFESLSHVLSALNSSK